MGKNEGFLMKSRKAFTLIELLVVVAIIVLLMALLMPNLARARDYAKMTKCGANMHAIGVALATYAGNNQGHVISAYDTQRDFGGGLTDSNWSDRLVLDILLPDGNRRLVIIELATGRPLGAIPLRTAP